MSRTLAVVACAVLLSSCVRRSCEAAMVAGVLVLDARYSVSSCCGDKRYAWTGKSCEAIDHLQYCGCTCEGRDCVNVFYSLAECQRAYRQCR